MVRICLADLVGKLTGQAQAMGFDTVEDALGRMEELHAKAVQMTYPDLEDALYDLEHYRLGDPSVHDREFQEEQSQCLKSAPSVS